MLHHLESDFCRNWKILYIKTFDFNSKNIRIIYYWKKAHENQAIQCFYALDLFFFLTFFNSLKCIGSLLALQLMQCCFCGDLYNGKSRSLLNHFCRRCDTNRQPLDNEATTLTVTPSMHWQHLSLFITQNILPGGGLSRTLYLLKCDNWSIWVLIILRFKLF